MKTIIVDGSLICPKCGDSMEKDVLLCETKCIHCDFKVTDEEMCQQSYFETDTPQKLINVVASLRGN